MAVDPALAKSLFLAASELPDSAERADYLHRACADNEELRARVEALLRVNDAMPLPPDEATAVAQRKVSPPITETENYSDLNAVAGMRIAGKYKLLQQIGEGGMGTVWMAEQTEPVKRRVAVKLIRTERGQSKTILSRFEAERQAIALMDHPHIAKLLDAGTTETGAPFFVMELVKGVPVTEYCDVHKLSIPDRLYLFVKICSAVQHAHQKGIIHRDLKPSNILVESHDGKPVPKVIDFGLAKATSGLQLTENTLFTGFGSVMGTPLYMAPEQANFNAIDIDTRVDVYALGVILFELLTGTTPLSRDTIKKAAIDEMLRLVREMEAPTPSSRLSSSDGKPAIAANRQMEPAKLGNFVKGELDWIVLKALSKERDRRYETANGFARDIERFLTHEPVQAGPPSTIYRLRKFVRRNRLQVIAAALVLMTLVAGVVGTSLALFEVQRQKEIALTEVNKKEKARKNTREALDTLTSDALSEWFTREQALSPVQTDVLQRLLGYYAEFAEEGGDVVEDKKGQVRALIRMGRIQRTLGDLQSAGISFRNAAELVGNATSPITADSDGLELVILVNSELSALNRADGDPKEAEIHCREMLAAAIRLKSETPPPHQIARKRIAAARVNLIGFLQQQKRFEEVAKELQLASAEFDQLKAELPTDGEVHENFAVLLQNHAANLIALGQTKEALQQNGRAMEIHRRATSESPGLLNPKLRLLSILRQRSAILATMRLIAEAVECRREAIQIGFSLYQTFPAVLEYRTYLADDYRSLSHHLRQQGKLDEAEKIADKGVAMVRQTVAEFPKNREVGEAFFWTLEEYSSLMRETRNLDKSEVVAREALAECNRLATLEFDSDRIRYLRARMLRFLAHVLQEQGKITESLSMRKSVLSDLARLVDDHPEVIENFRDLCQGHIEFARSLLSQRNVDAAIEELLSASRKLDLFTTATQPELKLELKLSVEYELAKALGVTGNWGESEKHAGRAIECAMALTRSRPDLQKEREMLCQSHWRRAVARDQLGRYSDSETDWKCAADLAEIPMDRAFYLAHRGFSLTKSGLPELAHAELSAAVLQLGTILKSNELPGITFYDAAVVYSLAAEAEADQNTAETHAVEAVRLLSRAAAVGFLKDPAQVKALQADDAFIKVRERSDYKELLFSLNQKIPPE
jgi:serine/threonine protein kinase